MKEKIIIGSDHAGFALKEGLKGYAEGKGIEVIDVGAAGLTSVDYPDFGGKVALGVSEGRYARGVLICASGVGMTIVANKYPRVRAALALDVETARMSRLHNDANILVLAGGKTEAALAFRIFDTWLATPFEGGRHEGRLRKISEIERNLGTGFGVDEVGK